MPAVGRLSLSEVVVSPGDDEVVGLTVRNVGSQPASFSIVTSGFVQGWTIIDPPVLTLPPGGEEQATVSLRPPRRWSVPAGASPLTIRIVSHDVPDEVAIVEGTVTVLAFDDRRLSLAQTVQRAKRRAEFDLVLENLGNARASCRVSLTDAAARLEATFSPPSIGVDPGESSVTRMELGSRRRRWRSGPRALPFEVSATQEGHTIVAASGTLLQTPMIDGRSFGRAFVALALAGALAAAWFGVLRPEIDDAAQRAAAELAASTTTVATSPTSEPPSFSASAEGTPFDTRLAVEAPLGGQSVTSYTVPEGRRLEVTDVLWQNPNGDSGRLELLRNSSSLYRIALENLTDYANALVTPYAFGAGERVNVQLSCTAIGDPNASDCAVAVTITGRLIDA